MSIKICHASDWHGEWRPLPSADMYIFTGDMIPDRYCYRGPPAHKIRDLEEAYQRGWVDGLCDGTEGVGLRWYLGNRDAPVVVCRGNHCFINIGSAFGGDVFEITEDYSRATNFLGLTIGGFRGINYVGGGGSDEFRDNDLDEMAKQLPVGLDILVTHTPPYRILDKVGFDYCGCRGINDYIESCGYMGATTGNPPVPKLHCFGHIHQCGGTILRKGDTLYSNAACTYNEIELGREENY